MNCKPGDLVIVVRETTAYCPFCSKSGKLDLRGKINTVTRLETLNWFNPVWLFAEPFVTQMTFPCGASLWGQVVGMDDSSLRPLRDDPEQDESLNWKTLPSTDKPKEIA